MKSYSWESTVIKLIFIIIIFISNSKFDGWIPLERLSTITRFANDVKSQLTPLLS